MEWSAKGKVVLVTGAGGGPGRALCAHFAARGARVAATDGDAEALAALSGEIVARGGTILTFPAGAADPDAAGWMVGAIVWHWGRIDVLIHNAGAGGEIRAAWITRHVVQRMKEAGGGHIFNVSATAGPRDGRSPDHCIRVVDLRPGGKHGLWRPGDIAETIGFILANPDDAPG